MLKRFPEESPHVDSGKSQAQRRNDRAIVLNLTAGNRVLTGQQQEIQLKLAEENRC